MRPLFVLMHRWVGLVMAGFLFVAGLTGSLLAWNDELDAAISPALFRATPPSRDARPLDPLVLREWVAARYPDAGVSQLSLRSEPGHAAVFSLQRASEASGASANDQMFVNPYTGNVLGERRWGDIGQGLRNFMPFVYRLHYSLALDRVGILLLGIVALAWTVDCFVGAYLTFPARRKTPLTPALSPLAGRGGRTWLARWWPAWQVRLRGGSYKVNFDLHRAGGLWTWAMLFVLAWSSVSFNLTEVYDPVMRTVFGAQADPRDLPSEPRRHGAPVLGWSEARETARHLMAEQARIHGFAIRAEDWMAYDADRRLYRYDVISSLDVNCHNGNTRVHFDADTGALRGVWLPTGAGGGDTIRTWITSLHMAALWGMPMKLFVCAMGLVVAMLSVTGVAIWWRKRTARRKSAPCRNVGQEWARRSTGYFLRQR